MVSSFIILFIFEYFYGIISQSALCYRQRDAKRTVIGRCSFVHSYSRLVRTCTTFQWRRLFKKLSIKHPQLLRADTAEYEALGDVTVLMRPSDLSVLRGEDLHPFAKKRKRPIQ